MIIVKPGTKIITFMGAVKAIITGICIRESSISYEISYFSGNQHTTAWIYRYEFEIDTATKQHAGLKNWDVPNENNDEYTINLLA